MTANQNTDTPKYPVTTSPFFSAIYTTLIQLSVFALAIFLSTFEISSGLLIVIQTLIALIFALILNLSIPWQLCNIILPGAIFFSSHSELPTNSLIGLMAVLFLIYIPTFWTRVPYYPASKKIVSELSKLLNEQKEDFTFIDLGSGFGELLFKLGKNFPNGHFVGVELSPLAFILAKIRALGYPNVEIHYQNFWKISLSEYDYIYAFLAPPPMEAIWKKVKKEAKKDSTILINSFPLPVKHSKKIAINDLRNSDLYIYYHQDL